MSVCVRPARSKANWQVLDAKLRQRAYPVQAHERPKSWNSTISTICRGRTTQALLRVNACVTAVAVTSAMSFAMSATASADADHRTDDPGSVSTAHPSEDGQVAHRPDRRQTSA